jgi:cytochrome c peroxidase
MNWKTIFAAGALILIPASMTAAANGLTPEEELGKNLFFDKISSPDWMSCASCHSPDVGWTGPNPGINK